MPKVCVRSADTTPGEYDVSYSNSPIEVRTISSSTSTNP